MEISTDRICSICTSGFPPMCVFEVRATFLITTTIQSLKKKKRCGETRQEPLGDASCSHWTESERMLEFPEEINIDSDIQSCKEKLLSPYKIWNPPVALTNIYSHFAAIKYILRGFYFSFLLLLFGFKSPSATPLLPCSCVEGSLPVALTYSPNLPLCLTYTNQHCNSISKKKKKVQNQTQSYILKYAFRKKEKKINMETSKLQKSVFSNQAHHTPHLKDRLYTRVVLPKDTRASTPLGSLTAGSLVGHVESRIHTPSNPNIF